MASGSHQPTQRTLDELLAAGPDPGPARLVAWDPASWAVAPDWQASVDRYFAGADAQRLAGFVRARLAAGATVFPPQPLRALALTPLDRVKVVILGQDPYHGPGQAQGLAFSVPPGIRPPPSLRNIRLEVARERRAALLAQPAAPACRPGPEPENGDLSGWAAQGVLLLNTCLTVEQGDPASHANRGWEALTDILIQAVDQKAGPVVFMLWGAHAQSRGHLLSTTSARPRLQLLASHPSPLSARRKPLAFLGCGHFARANDFLRQHGAAPIDW